LQTRRCRRSVQSTRLTPCMCGPSDRGLTGKVATRVRVPLGCHAQERTGRSAPPGPDPEGSRVTPAVTTGQPRPIDLRPSWHSTGRRSSIDLWSWLSRTTERQLGASCWTRPDFPHRLTDRKGGGVAFVPQVALPPANSAERSVRRWRLVSARWSAIPSSLTASSVPSRSCSVWSSYPRASFCCS
jgi:hypothetical protein